MKNCGLEVGHVMIRLLQPRQLSPFMSFMVDQEVFANVKL